MNLGPNMWLRVICGTLPLIGAVAIAWQRLGTSTAPWAVPVALLAATPWVLGAFGIYVPTPIWVCIVLGSTLALLSHPLIDEFAPFQLIVLAATAAVSLPRTQSVAVLIAAVGVMFYGQFARWYPGSYSLWILGIMLAWFGSYSSRLQQQLVDEAHAAQAEAAGRAAAEERERIARELHDVVAHSLAVTMLNLSGARLAFERDPAAAYEAIVQAERHGRQSLADIRRTVGLLAPESATTIDPMPTAADVGGLVEEYRQAGLAVQLSISGELDALPPTTGLALYRIMQESLANVSKHAPGAGATADVTLADGCARLVVVNPAVGLTSGDGDGRGVTGMRQRATLLGGSLDAGVRNGSWRVEAVLPIETPQ